MIPLTLAHKRHAQACLRESFSLGDIELLANIQAQEGIAPLLEFLLAVGIAWQEAQTRARLEED